MLPIIGKTEILNQNSNDFLANYKHERTAIEPRVSCNMNQVTVHQGTLCLRKLLVTYCWSSWNTEIILRKLSFIISTYSGRSHYLQGSRYAKICPTFSKIFSNLFEQKKKTSQNLPLVLNSKCKPKFGLLGTKLGNVITSITAW